MVKSGQLEAEIKADLEKQLKDPTPRKVGYIVSANNPKDTLHVTPMLFQMGPDNKNEALLLDIPGPNGHLSEHVHITNILQRNNIPYAQCDDQRQVDEFSCRVGALVVLRNALMDFQSSSKSSLLEKVHPENGKFSIPPKWGYNEQIHRPKSKDDYKELDEPRSLKSKKGKPKRSLEEARAKNNEELKFKCTLTLPKSPLTKDFSVSNSPEGMKFKRLDNGQINIKWESRVKVNTYMIRKGHKLAG